VPSREQLLQVLEASGSEPIKFPPVKLWLDGDWYVDGGVRAYTPIKAALAAGADELFIVMHSPRNGNVTVAQSSVENFFGVVGQTLNLLLANASAMDFAQADALANGVEIENRIVAPREPIVGVGSGPNTQGRRIFNQGFADAQQVWGPLLQQRPDLVSPLQGGAPVPRERIARGMPAGARPRVAAEEPSPRPRGRGDKLQDEDLVAFWTPRKPARRRRAKAGAKKAAKRAGKRKMRTPKRKASAPKRKTRSPRRKP
jgi:hypothetical protein